MGTYNNIRIGVQDQFGASDFLPNFSITVEELNLAPVVSNPIPNRSATEDSAFSYTVPFNTFSDPNAGDTLTWSASTLPSWLSFNTSTRLLSGTPNNSQVGSNTVQIRVQDNDGASVTDTFTVTVANTNDAPTVGAGVANQSTPEDVPFSFTVPSNAFVDVDSPYGDTLTWAATSLPTWVSFNTGTRTLSGTPLQSDVGTAGVTLRATDNSGLSISTSFSITVTEVNDAPTLSNAIPNQTGTEDSAFSYTVPSNTFADSDPVDSLTWSAPILPSWLSFNPGTRVLSGTPLNADVGSNTVQIRVQDNAGAAVTDTFTVTVANTNDAPTVGAGVANQSTPEDVPYSFTVASNAFVDVDSAYGDTLVWAATTLPTWLSFNPATRVLSGTPVQVDVGSAPVTLQVTDLAGLSVSTSFSVAVSEVNDNPPSFTSGGSITVAEGLTATGYVATSTDIDTGDSVSYSLSGSDATAFSIGAASGVLTFNTAPDFELPGDSGANNLYDMIITATDAVSNTSTLALIVTVSDINDETPVWSSPSAVSVDENSVTAFYTATANDADAGDVLSFSLPGGDDLALFTLDSSSGELRFTAAADFEIPGDANTDNLYQLTLQVSDAAGNSAALAVTVTVDNINEPPVAVDQSFSISEFATLGTTLGSLLGSDPENDIQHWSLLTAGSPFTLSDGGVLSLSAAIDFELTPLYLLNTEVDDGMLITPVLISVALVDENEIVRLTENLPATAADLSAEGVVGAVAERESFYNTSITAASPQPSTLAELQNIIDRSNAILDIIAASGADADTITEQLLVAGVVRIEPSNASAYQSAIASASPTPVSTAELQALVDEVNAVTDIRGLAAQIHTGGEGDNSVFAAAIAAIDGMPLVDPELLGELAALIDRSDPAPSTELELIALVNQLLNRVNTHPVVYLRVQQGGKEVQALRLEGGLVSISVLISNPVDGLIVSYDWGDTGTVLLALATEVTPITATLTIDPSSLTGGELLIPRVSVLRNGLRADAELSIAVAAPGTAAADIDDSDGDGVLDAFEGALEATVDPAAAARLQTVAGEDFAFVMAAETDTVLRLGTIARVAQLNQSRIELEHIVLYQAGASTEQVIDALPTVSSLAVIEVFDFEVAALSHVGASTAIVLPLSRALLSNAAYVKYHPATGWLAFVENSLNRLASAPAIGDTLGQCPAADHSSWLPGLSSGHGCLRLTLEDGGPNDADRLLSDGSSSPDRGLNGHIKDPGAIVYRYSAGLTDATDVLTGTKGSGSLTLRGLLLLLSLLLLLKAIAFTRRDPSTHGSTGRG